jgi:poly-gamma-glutamate capsule biosynthesis protein CapA/YwtB (metallophosphatase superfamily)
MADAVSIGLVGDLMLGRMVNEHLRAGGTVWGNTLPLLRHNDLNIGNLECALTRSETPVPKVFNFKADPEQVTHLQEFDALTVANNHLLDYGEEGMRDTLETLERAGIPYVGLGKELVLDAKGLRIGLIGCTDQGEPPQRSLDGIEEEILALRHHVDLLILTVHWGPNMVERPPPSFRELAHRWLEAGVDVLHGHSAHLFQGVEQYRGKLILYDTGDFVDDYMIDPVLRNDRSFFFTIEVDQAGLRELRMTPVIIEDCEVNIATGDDRRAALARMELLSSELGTTFVRDHQSLRLDFTGS